MAIVRRDGIGARTHAAARSAPLIQAAGSSLCSAATVQAVSSGNGRQDWVMLLGGQIEGLAEGIQVDAL